MVTIPALVTVFLIGNSGQSAHAWLTKERLTANEKIEIIAVTGKIYADVCHAQTGQFAEFVKFFSAPASNGRKTLIEKGMGIKYYNAVVKSRRGSWAHHLNTRHQDYKIKECKKILSELRSRVD